jgi:hypothetical protein
VGHLSHNSLNIFWGEKMDFSIPDSKFETAVVSLEIHKEDTAKMMSDVIGFTGPIHLANIFPVDIPNDLETNGQVALFDSQK